MLSERIQKMTPSATLSLNQKAGELTKQGIDIINMAVGQPDFQVPENIRLVAEKAAREGHGKYTPATGKIELRQAISGKFKRENNLKYDVNEIVVASGAKPILFATVLALCNPGDEVIVPAPYWVTYPDDIRLCGANPVFVEAREENKFAITADAIAEKITDKTRLLILNDPSNPTGAIIPKEEKEKIAELCLKHNIWILSDEIYERLVFEEEYFSIASLGEDIWNKTITLNGLSKTYAMPGWRIGYAGIPLELAKKIGGALSHITGNPNTIAQIAGIEALNGSQDEVGKMIQIYKKRRDMFLDGLSKIEGIKCVKPGGAFYLYPNLSSHYDSNITNSTQMAEKLLVEAHIAAVPGAAFGTDEHVRLSFATSEEKINECLIRLEKFFG
ncbi:pyridoxal phosphate-dependent aminotransferase [bacterium]|nr:pyridoxal phosphate-dependent aminotransferase [bacterium]